MRSSIHTFTVASLISLSLLSPLAFADDDIHEIEAISKELGLITLEQAKTKALAAKPGAVADVDLQIRFTPRTDYPRNTSGSYRRTRWVWLAQELRHNGIH